MPYFPVLFGIYIRKGALPFKPQQLLINSKVYVQGIELATVGNKWAPHLSHMGKFVLLLPLTTRIWVYETLGRLWGTQTCTWTLLATARYKGHPLTMFYISLMKRWFAWRSWLQWSSLESQCPASSGWCSSYTKSPTSYHAHGYIALIIFFNSRLWLFLSSTLFRPIQKYWKRWRAFVSITRRSFFK